LLVDLHAEDFVTVEDFVPVYLINSGGPQNYPFHKQVPSTTPTWPTLPSPCRLRRCAIPRALEFRDTHTGHKQVPSSTPVWPTQPSPDRLGRWTLPGARRRRIS